MIANLKRQVSQRPASNRASIAVTTKGQRDRQTESPPRPGDCLKGQHDGGLAGHQGKAARNQ